MLLQEQQYSVGEPPTRLTGACNAPPRPYGTKLVGSSAWGAERVLELDEELELGLCSRAAAMRASRARRRSSRRRSARLERELL